MSFYDHNCDGSPWSNGDTVTSPLVTAPWRESVAEALHVFMATHCQHCLRPMASEADWESAEEGERTDLCWEDPANCLFVSMRESQYVYADALALTIERLLTEARAEGRSLGRYEMTVGHKPDPRDPNYEAGRSIGRAEERERIAQAIEAMSVRGPDNRFQHASSVRASAARIARTAAQPATSTEEER